MGEPNLFERNANIKINQDFIETQKILNTIEGWFSPVSHGLFDCFLNLQKDTGVSGHLGEIGVWAGKSASIICKHADSHEKIFLIEPNFEKRKEEIQNNIAKVCKKLPANICPYPIRSENYSDIAEKGSYSRRVRFFHIDGQHCAESVDNDLNIAHEILNNEGIAVLDDFFSFEYPQITEALYSYISHNPYRLRLFFIGGSKAYLCRPGAYAAYYRYCIESMQKHMIERGIPMHVMKTSGIADSFTASAVIYVPTVHSASGMQGPDWDRRRIECPQCMDV